jgi:hypothetical protein
MRCCTTWWRGTRYYGTAIVKSIFTSVKDDRVLQRLEDADREGFFFRGMSENMFLALTTQQLSYYHHKLAVMPEAYEHSHQLRDFFKITATGKDQNGKRFVASA